MATKYSLSEQVMLRLKGGRPDMANTIDMRDIILAVGQAVNELIKGQHLSVTLPGGETIPDGCVLATYDNIPVEQWKTVSRSKLPVMPVSLNRGMGVFEVAKTDDPFCVFIPAQAGQLAMVKSQKLISDLTGNYGYELSGDYIIYSKNLLSDSVSSVMMRLVVKDVTGLGDYDPLPIPADYESLVIENVFGKFANMGRSDKDNDTQTENIAS